MKPEDIQIVLVETSHPGNIGAAARAMKNMGLSRLALVNPQCRIDETAIARASGALDILDDCRRFDSLPEAIADSELVIGSSARPRSLSWPELDPRGMAGRVAALPDGSRVSLLLGRERSGLSNEELQHCHVTVKIPTAPDYSSLNVAMALQLLAYELFIALAGEGDGQGGTGAAKREPAASAGELEGFFAHLQQVIVATGFLDPDNPRQMMKRLRRLFQRCGLTRNEVNILRGILSSVRKFSDS
jgi:TrmH family RNA methyltransferase